MNGTQIFAFFVLPALLAAGGLLTVIVHERKARSQRRHP